MRWARTRTSPSMMSIPSRPSKKMSDGLEQEKSAEFCPACGPGDSGYGGRCLHAGHPQPADIQAAPGESGSRGDAACGEGKYRAAAEGAFRYLHAAPGGGACPRPGCRHEGIELPL